MFSRAPDLPGPRNSGVCAKQPQMGGRELAYPCLGILTLLLGSGLPLFPARFPQRDFVLVENKTYSKSQVSLTYRRVRSKGKRK